MSTAETSSVRLYSVARLACDYIQSGIIKTGGEFYQTYFFLSALVGDLYRYNRVVLTSCTKKVTPNNPRDEYLISKIKACPTGFCRIYVTCYQVKQNSLKHANMSLHDFELPLKIRHNDSMASGQGILQFECLKWSK